MLARQRHAYILDRVRADGGVRVADLVRELAVSDMTIRRDLELLHEQGLLEKVHGGATTLPASALFEPGFSAKVDSPAGGQGGHRRLQQPPWSIRVRRSPSRRAPRPTRSRGACWTCLVSPWSPTRCPWRTSCTTVDGRTRPSSSPAACGRRRTRWPVRSRSRPCARSTSTWCSWVSMAWTHGPASRPPTCWRPRRTGRSWRRAGGWWWSPTTTKWGVIGVSTIARFTQADLLISDAGLSDAARAVAGRACPGAVHRG